jgi:hypothetical protein
MRPKRSPHYIDRPYRCGSATARNATRRGWWLKRASALSLPAYPPEEEK